MRQHLYCSYLKCPQIPKVLLGKTFNELFNRFSYLFQSPGVEEVLRKVKEMRGLFITSHSHEIERGFGLRGCVCIQ